MLQCNNSMDRIISYHIVSYHVYHIVNKGWLALVAYLLKIPACFVCLSVCPPACLLCYRRDPIMIVNCTVQGLVWQLAGYIASFVYCFLPSSRKFPLSRGQITKRPLRLWDNLTDNMYAEIAELKVQTHSPPLSSMSLGVIDSGGWFDSLHMLDLVGTYARDIPHEDIFYAASKDEQRRRRHPWWGPNW